MRVLLKDLLHTQQIIDVTDNNSEYTLLSGPRRALTHLSEMMKEDAQINSSCHPIAHNLGRVAYQYHGSLYGAFDGMLDTDPRLLRLCNAAYLHGVIEYSLRDTPINNLGRESLHIVERVCNKMADVNMGRWECQ